MYTYKKPDEEKQEALEIGKKNIFKMKVVSMQKGLKGQQKKKI